MSFDTWISILITSFVTIAVALISILAPMGFPENKKKEQKRKSKNDKNKQTKIIKINKTKLIINKISKKITQQHKITLYLLLLSILVIIVSTIIYIIQKPSTYKEVLNKADFEFENQNYIDAAKYYNEAAHIAYNNETKVTAIYSEGLCYFLLGINTNDNNYFSKALKKYYMIIENKKYINTEYYQDALIDANFISRKIYGNLNDETLIKIITELENTYDFTCLDNISENDIDLMNKVALVLAVYYKDIANECFEIEDYKKTKEYSDKAINYYNIVCQLTPQADQLHFEKTDLFYYKMEISELMLKGFLYAKNIEDMESTLNNIIVFCSNAVEDLETSEKVSDTLEFYLRLKINLGKSYYFLSLMAGDEYLSNAYNELQPLLDLNVSKDAEYKLLDAGYYIILTKKCTDEEIEIILNRYEIQLKEMTFENEDYPKTLQSALSTCNNIVDIYGQNKHAIKLRDELSIKMDNILNIFKK